MPLDEDYKKYRDKIESGKIKNVMKKKEERLITGLLVSNPIGV